MTFVRLYIALLIFCAACVLFAIYCMIFNPAHAGDTAPGAHLWPKRDYAVSIPMGELPHCTELGNCCDWHPCSISYNRTPDPAPVPTPEGFWLLAAAIAALSWKGKRA